MILQALTPTNVTSSGDSIVSPPFSLAFLIACITLLLALTKSVEIAFSPVTILSKSVLLVDLKGLKNFSSIFSVVVYQRQIFSGLLF